MSYENEEVFHCSKCSKSFVLPHHCEHYVSDKICDKLDEIIKLLEQMNSNTIDVETAVQKIEAYL